MTVTIVRARDLEKVDILEHIRNAEYFMVKTRGLGI